MAAILVVDDDAAFLRLLDLMLRRENHTVTMARSAKEALHILDVKSVDMVITDIFMPKMDGFTFISLLRADRRYKDLPVAVLTASGRRHLANQAVKSGADGFLLKPFSSWELKKTLADCLGISWNMQCDHAREGCYCTLNAIPNGIPNAIPNDCPIYQKVQH
jgi:CheY-like chemotaxis protein